MAYVVPSSFYATLDVIEQQLCAPVYSVPVRLEGLSSQSSNFGIGSKILDCIRVINQ